MSPNIDTPKVETKSVTEERINKVLDVFSGTDWTSGSGKIVRCQESRNYRSYIWVGGDNSFCLKSVSRVLVNHVCTGIT